MKLMLIDDSGQVVDSTEVTAEDLQQAADYPMGAQALIRAIAT